MRLWLVLLIGWVGWMAYLGFSDKSSQGLGQALYQAFNNTILWILIFAAAMVTYEVFSKLRKKQQIEKNRGLQEKANKISQQIQEQQLENLSNELEIKKIQNNLLKKILHFFKAS